MAYAPNLSQHAFVLVESSFFHLTFRSSINNFKTTVLQSQWFRNLKLLRNLALRTHKLECYSYLESGYSNLNSLKKTSHKMVKNLGIDIYFISSLSFYKFFLTQSNSNMKLNPYKELERTKFLNL